MKYIAPPKAILFRVLFFVTIVCIFATIVATGAGIPYASVPGLALEGILNFIQEESLVSMGVGGMLLFYFLVPWSGGGYRPTNLGP